MVETDTDADPFSLCATVVSFLICKFHAFEAVEIALKLQHLDLVLDWVGGLDCSLGQSYIALHSHVVFR